MTGDARVRECVAMVRRYGSYDVPLLLLGETGTGKGELARLAHECSPRARHPMHVVDLSGLSLFESELFGHARGSFTGAHGDHPGHLEAVGQGTLFLDEIGELDVHQQVKLLGLVQTGRYYRVGDTRERRSAARLVFATNRDLEQEVQAGRFRRDLLYRIGQFGIRLPPLRERVGDIGLIANHYVRVFAERYGRPIRGIAPRAQAALDAHPFPGNVRELEGMIERAVIDEPSAWLQPKSLGLAVRPRTRHRFDDERLGEVLAKCRGDQGRAADVLGVRRETVNRRAKRMLRHGAASAERVAEGRK